MGQDISQAVLPPPLTLTHCFVDGNIDMGRYFIFKRRQALHEKGLALHRLNNKKRRRHFKDTMSPHKKSQEKSQICEAL